MRSGMIDGVVLAVLAEEAALGLGVDSDHGVLGAIQHEGAATGRAVGKERLGHVGVRSWPRARAR